MRFSSLWTLKPHCEGWVLQDVRTFQIQKVLEQAARDRRLSKNKLKHTKVFLSGVFRFACQQGVCGRANPVTAVSIPNAPGPRETHAYNLSEIEAIARVLPEPAATAVLVAAFTGMRLGEIHGMLWQKLPEHRALWLLQHYPISLVWPRDSSQDAEVNGPRSDNSSAP